MPIDFTLPGARHDRAGIGANWPTGAKLFLILSAALLPLALLAIYATLQTTRVAATEARARLRVASAESSRALAIELVGDTRALGVAMRALATDPKDSPSCARAQGVFAQQAATGAHFMIAARDGTILCGAAFAGMAAPRRSAMPSAPTARLLPGRGLAIDIAAPGGSTYASALFPVDFLRTVSRPSGFGQPFAATLTDGDAALSLATLEAASPLERRDTIRNNLGIAGLWFEMQARGAPISSPTIVALMLPLMMWGAAASIAWLVVDHLLIRPLRALRQSVSTYAPGEEIDARIVRGLPAQEIRELGDTFRAISRTVAIHEAGLAEGLVKQQKLTREVHHRVKNNLQVISSLINFHARGAVSDEATRAYASIQRRVDALAVVHRNHFAEMEENRGLGLRSVIGELASNIRATAPEGSALGITLDLEPVLVSQDTAVAVAFLLTEAIELASSVDPSAQLRISVKPTDNPDRAVLRVSARTLIESDILRDGIARRYGRVMDGLARQLRAPLHHDPLSGAFEIAIAITGRE